MTTRRRLLLHAWVQTALWLGLVVVANHLGAVAFLRLDVTGDQRFSLSQTATASVAELDRPLVAQLWFTQDLDPPYHNHLDAARDVLEALRARADGQLEVEVVDPTGDKDAIAQASGLGIQPVTYTRKDWDRQEARQVFMGLALVYGNRQVAVPALPSVERMEYEIVRAIRNVTTEPEDRPKVAWLQGDAEPDLSSFPATNPLGKLRDELSGSMELVPVSLAEEPMPEDVDALLVIGPQLAVPELTRLHLDQFVMRGGAVAWFVAGIQPDFRTAIITEVRHGLHPLLGHYGARLNRDVLLDRTRNEAMVAPVQVDGQTAFARVSYPLAVVSRALDRVYGPVRDVERAVLPFATTLTLADPLPDGVDAEVWVRTEPSAVSSRDVRALRADLLAIPGPGEVPGPFASVVALSGRFPSYYADRGLPVGPRGEPTLRPDEVLEVSEPTRMVVASSADMVANNPALVENAVDWLLEDPALIAVRARHAHQAALPTPTREQALRARLAIVGAPLGGLGLLALFTWVRSRSAR